MGACAGSKETHMIRKSIRVLGVGLAVSITAWLVGQFLIILGPAELVIMGIALQIASPVLGLLAAGIQLLTNGHSM